jgi:hypothetical protein
MTNLAVMPHSPNVNPDGRIGQRLPHSMQVRLSATQHAYLSDLAEQRGSSVSEELRACVDEAMVASIEARRRRQAEVRRIVEGVRNGDVDPADHPDLFTPRATSDES